MNAVIAYIIMYGLVLTSKFFYLTCTLISFKQFNLCKFGLNVTLSLHFDSKVQVRAVGTFPHNLHKSTKCTRNCSQR